MAAGLGFKTFTTGEVLTAADTNGYLMQGVLVFASSAARAAAITSPQEGQYSYLKDTNSTEYYDGAAWIAAPIGDITGVTAGVGISGGGTSGTVTVTNSMATAIDAKGDLIAGTAADTFDRLAVGTNGQTLVADSTASTGLKWATPSSGAATAAGCYIYKSTSQSISNNTATALTFDAESFDTDAYHSTSSNTSRITIPTGKGGKYQVNTTILFANSTTGVRRLEIWVNGALYQQDSIAVSSSDGRIFMTLASVLSLAAADYIEIYVFQSSGGALNVWGDDTNTKCSNFSVGYLGA